MPDVITVFLNKDEDNDDDEISGLTCTKVIRRTNSLPWEKELSFVLQQKQ